MASLANRRSVMMLFSLPTDAQSHRVRIVMAEKDIPADIIHPDSRPEDLATLNPYSLTPTLVDRDLVLYPAEVIMEYLDERFPHPPLLPVDPVSRAKCRLLLYRINRDWYEPLATLTGGEPAAADAARKQLAESVAGLGEIVSGEANPFILGEEFTLADVSAAPVLWRLPYYGVELPGPAKSVHQYAERLFSRPGFQASLSEAERNMR